MTASVSQYKAQSDNRGGIIHLAFGVLCITAGLGSMIAMLPPAGNIFINLISVCRSIAGNCAESLPLPLLTSGVLLCVSSRRRVSFRGYLILITIYLCIMAIFTLTTTIPLSHDYLMDYIGKKLGNNDSTWVSYISYVYQKINYSGGLGAGALGMILAYPLFSVFHVIGSIIFLSFSVITLIVWLFRIDLTCLFRSLSEHTINKTSEQPLKYVHKEKKDQDKTSIPAYGSGDVNGYISGESRTSGNTQTDDADLYLIPDDGYVDQTPAGFVPVQAGLLYEQHITETQNQEHAHPTSYQPGDQPYAQQQPVTANSFVAAKRPADSAKGETEDTFDGIRHRRRTEKRNTNQQNVTPNKINTQDSFVQSSATSGKNAAGAPAYIQPAITSSGTSQQHQADMTSPVFNLHEGRQTQEQGAKPAAAFGSTATNKIPADKPAAVPFPDPVLPGVEIDTLMEPGHTSGMRKKTDVLSNNQPIPVHTDPAVVLTGERIPITTKGSKSVDMSISTVQEKTKQLEIPYYEKPPVRLLNDPPAQANLDTSQEDNAAAERLEQTLASFNISAEVKHITHGPAITRFALRLAEGINVRRVTSLMDNIAMEMKTMGVRAEVPILGTSLVGIEVRNKQVSLVTLREVLDSPEMNAVQSPMTVALGKDIMGTPVLCNLSDMPHLLIAGATGSGKSVCINSIISSILYRATPRQVRLIMIDPKMVELQPYNGIPHLLLPVVSNLKKAAGALDWVVQEMNDRYQKLQMVGARNIANYNQLIGSGDDQMPYIVLIIDELSDLMTVCKKSVEESIMRLASLARAAGICLVLATQRPSVDVITGVIKANIPSRIAFAVSSQVDSRTIIDGGGAEKLAGSGDMLYAPRTELKPKRVQGCYISDSEVAAVTKYVKARNQANYDLDIIDHVEKNEVQPDQSAEEGESDSARDEFWEEAIEMAIESGQMSISMLQRRLRIGYARAGRLIDEMAKYGIISSSEGSKSRKTLLTREEYKKKQGEGYLS
jgi:DNA segregation ATPase FtsK/SpoIIIE-like protein